MSSETKVIVYYGPRSWFEGLVTKKKQEGLLEAVFARDERLRQLTVVLPDRGDEVGESSSRRRRPKRLIAESGDFASLQEHAITNFAGLVQAHNPKELHLHNPPEHVHSHLQRAFSDSFEAIRYGYPAVTKEVLVNFRDGFSRHLIGQEDVRKSLLATLYSLTRESRVKPVVAMFYGPSGVGKTETAQFINGLVGGQLMRKQFSMFHNEKFASYLFGGSHSEPSFAHDLLDRESGVVLIDEFDKAASVFHSAFYEFFDGGVFQDKNYRVDVGRSLIICTSNYGSEKEIRDVLGDALYSRFDTLIKFEPLSQHEVSAVIERLVDDRIASLAADELQVVDATEIKKLLSPLAVRSANIRRLGKIADELISTILVNALLAQESLSGASVMPDAEGPSTEQ